MNDKFEVRFKIASSFTEEGSTHSSDICPIYIPRKNSVVACKIPMAWHGVAWTGRENESRFAITTYVPMHCVMRKSWSMSDSPGKRGSPVRISA